MHYSQYERGLSLIRKALGILSYQQAPFVLESTGAKAPSLVHHLASHSWSLAQEDLFLLPCLTGVQWPTKHRLHTSKITFHHRKALCAFLFLFFLNLFSSIWRGCMKSSFSCITYVSHHRFAQPQTRSPTILVPTANLSVGMPTGWRWGWSWEMWSFPFALQDGSNCSFRCATKTLELESIAMELSGWHLQEKPRARISKTESPPTPFRGTITKL